MKVKICTFTMQSLEKKTNWQMVANSYYTSLELLVSDLGLELYVLTVMPMMNY